MMIYEITGMGPAQYEKVKGFGVVERVDIVTVNVTVDDEFADAISTWLEQQKLEYRSV